MTNRVGLEPTQEIIDKIYEAGGKRYSANVPPGVKDDKKGSSSYANYSYNGLNYQSKYGDLVLWFQIKEFAKSKKDSSVILLTDDKKEDWWWIVESEGKKTLGPRPELVSEICRESEVKNFYMYNSDQFLKYAKQYLGANVSEESIGQIKEIAARDNRGVTLDRIEAVKAIVEWIEKRHPGATIKHKFDTVIVKLPDSDELICYSIYQITTLRMLHEVVQSMYSIVLNSKISLRNLSRVEFVFYMSDTGYEAGLAEYILKILNKFSLAEIPGVISKSTLGVISKSEDGVAHFLPLPTLAP